LWSKFITSKNIAINISFVTKLRMLSQQHFPANYDQCHC
jgi:hypothetical protein